MKLTEQQLSQLYQDSTQNNNCEVVIGDYLISGEYDARLDQAEAILNDRCAAQGLALASHFKNWSEKVANDIQVQHTPLSARVIAFCQNLLPKSAMTMPAMAVFFALTVVVFLSAQKFSSSGQDTGMVNTDVIKSMPFEGHQDQSDRLSKGGFDSSDEPDQLFNSNFS